MNRLSSEQRAAVISCLIEGNSIRSTVRITGREKDRYAPGGGSRHVLRRISGSGVPQSELRTDAG